MEEQLLHHYNEELAFIYQEALKFAEKYPKIAAKLKIDYNNIQDPHVERLIQAFAFMNAKINCKLKDNYEEFLDLLLQQIYPHYRTNLPSTAIIEFKNLPDNKASISIPKGTLIEAKNKFGTCTFSTCYSTLIWPITLESVVSGLCTIEGYKSQKAITFSFKGNNGSTFNNLNVNYIRMYIKNNLIYNYNLLHALTQKTKKILLSDQNNTSIIPLEPKQCLQPVGFHEDEGLLDINDQFLGYRLLTEFFCFIEKFLFLAIKIPSHLNSNVIKLSFLIEDFPDEVEQFISTENFSLTATPIINLFKFTSDPISVDKNLHKHKVIPNKLHESMIKVCDIKEVHGVDQYGNKKYIAPLYGMNHYDENIDNQIFWVANKDNHEMYISMVDLNHNKCNQKFDFIYADLYCSNGEWATKLEITNELELSLLNCSAPLQSIVFLLYPSKPIDIADNKTNGWRLLSHLSANYLNFNDANLTKKLLCEMLELYNFDQRSYNKVLINSIIKLEFKKVLIKSPSKLLLHYCKGVEVVIYVSMQRLPKGYFELFLQILTNFFVCNIPMNSAIQITAICYDTNNIIFSSDPEEGYLCLI